MPDYYPQQTADPIEILLVEDNPGDVRLIQEALASTEPETVLHPITKGDEAIDRLRELASDEADALPDFVLLDLKLPGCDGCDVLNKIRAHPELEFLPVIMLTSSSAPEDVDRCYSANANAYLTKPSRPDNFEVLMENLLQFWGEEAVLPPIPV